MPSSRPLVSALSATLTFSSASWAAPPAELRVVTTSACPSQEQLVRPLAALLPQTRIEPDVSLPSANASLEVVDHGDSVAATLTAPAPDAALRQAESKTFEDPERDCAERGRSIAVYVALTLDPPVLAAEPPDRSAASRAEPDRGPSHETRTPARGVEIEGGPVFLAAALPGATDLTTTGGGALRFAQGSPLGLSLGVAALLPTTLRFETANARAQWVPVDLSGRLQALADPVELALEVGGVAAILSVHGQDLAGSERQQRLELGARGALVVRRWLNDVVGVYASLQALAFPRPYRLVVEPDETLGTTPHVWFGASVGLAVDLR